MSQYFDKDFFRFLAVFSLIILCSVAIIVGTMIYESRSSDEVDTASNIANTQP